ncbi:(S)-mandelate dehydrogenase [Colletotrichum shisoi]|uniref:(S)-mandelate dehydrogenase n=1 Tax=Colletotrichum shisoi TaxID=2078593 RepID=A0A5Q4BHF0_9PEZI|nr:(S)-mandelate dehydrogenase [Colletotrichum shisoi]
MDSFWVVVHGQMWDVTEFLNEHPGGANLIIKCAGRDATEDYDSIHTTQISSQKLSPRTAVWGPPQEPSTDSAAKPEPAAYPHHGAIINVVDFARVAESYLSPMGWAYYSSGAEDERSLHDSRCVFRKLALRPRILRDVDSVCTGTTILGLPSSLPF